MHQPIASLSLDLDNLWSYQKTRGDPAWEALPSYLDVVVPRFLEVLERRGLHITVMVVGQDAALERNAGALRAIADAGHEIGNHSFRHEPWLHRYTDDEMADEIARAEAAIETATGRRPRGFRGPGYSFTRRTLEVLHARGYDYDASTLPTFIGPMARAYYFMTSGLDREARNQRDALFGSVSDGLRSIDPYRWDLGSGRSIVEIPVTTLPGLRLPFHPSYILYLAAVAPMLGDTYFRSAVLACRAARTEPSVLLHPLDFLDGQDAPSLSFFPAMSMPWQKKVAVVERALDALQTHFRVVPMRAHAADIASRTTPLRGPP